MYPPLLAHTFRVRSFAILWLSLLTSCLVILLHWPATTKVVPEAPKFLKKVLDTPADIKTEIIVQSAGSKLNIHNLRTITVVLSIRTIRIIAQRCTRDRTTVVITLALLAAVFVPRISVTLTLANVLLNRVVSTQLLFDTLTIGTRQSYIESKTAVKFAPLTQPPLNWTQEHRNTGTPSITPASYRGTFFGRSVLARPCTTTARLANFLATSFISLKTYRTVTVTSVAFSKTRKQPLNLP